MVTIFCAQCRTPNDITATQCVQCGAGLDMVRRQYREADRHYQRALSLVEEDCLADAILAMQAALEQAPGVPKFANLLGTLYAKQGMYELARGQWRQALLGHADSAEACRNLEMCDQIEQRDYLRRLQIRPWRIVVGILGVCLVLSVTWATYMSRRAASSLGRTSPNGWDDVDGSLAEQLAQAQQQIVEMQSQLAAAQEDGDLTTLRQQLDERTSQLNALTAKYEQQAAQLEHYAESTLDTDTRAGESLQLQQFQAQIAALQTQLWRRDGVPSTHAYSEDVKELLPTRDERIKTLEQQLATLGMHEGEGAPSAELADLQSQLKAYQIHNQTLSQQLAEVREQLAQQQSVPTSTPEPTQTSPPRVVASPTPRPAAARPTPAPTSPPRAQPATTTLSAEDYMERAKAEIRQGNIDRAITNVEEALRKDPRDEGARLLLRQLRSSQSR